MTDSATLLALSERVEKLSGPSEEVDALIRCALWAPEGAYVERSTINGAWCVHHVGRDGKARLFERPLRVTWEVWKGQFTSSLDAAMTLADERDVSELLCEAMDRLGQAGWQEGSYKQRLAQFFTAASLRALASTEVASSLLGEGGR